MNPKDFARHLRKNPTKAEAFLWQYLRGKQIKNQRIHRQYPIIYQENNQQYNFIADFYHHPSKLIIELDGEIHLLNQSYDQLRTEKLNLLGHKVIRFSNQQVFENIDMVIQTITAHISPFLIE